MKAFILFFLSICVSSYALAQDVAFFNKNKLYDIEVTYKFCQYTHGFSCSQSNTLIVKSKKNPSEKNYKIIVSPSDSETIMVVSAIEKDSSGKIYAQAKYMYPNGFGSHCGFPLLMRNSTDPTYFKFNVVIALDDMDESPIIMCQASGYAAY